MPSEALGLLECKGLIALMEGTDAMLKSANVEMMGWDKCGSGMVTAFVRGDVAAVKAAIDAGAEAAGRIGTVVSAHVIARPHDEIGGLLPKPKKVEAGKPVAPVSNLAIGSIETKGWVGLVEGTDAMGKAANVEIIKTIQIGGAFVTTIVRGDVGSVKAAVDAGAEAAGKVGELVASHVIARPHADLLAGYGATV